MLSIIKPFARFILAGSLCTSAFLFTSCEEIDELPPRTDASTSSQYYKLPDPVLLTAEESAQVDAIRQEYEQSLNQATNNSAL